jgi:hypothetical protein
MDETDRGVRRYTVTETRQAVQNSIKRASR